MRQEYQTLINKKKASSHKSNKKTQSENTPATLTDTEIFTYENLPF